MNNPAPLFSPQHYLELEALCDQFERELDEDTGHKICISSFVSRASAEIQIALGRELSNILQEHNSRSNSANSSAAAPGERSGACETRHATTHRLTATRRGYAQKHNGEGKTFPSRFGRLTLESIVGRGGSGVVWRAFDEALSRFVAVKISHPYSDAESERFVREAQSVASLKHANIIPIYEAGDFEGCCYIISEFCDGRPLSDLVNDQPIDSKRAVQILASVSSAIAHSHEKGIVHRDLKPQNILIATNGTPLVTDFGLAKRLGHEQTLTLEGELIGTPAYMAPEQASGGGGECDERTDIYSLGAILFQMLTGSVPFAGSFERVVFQVIHSPAPDLRTIKPDVPRDLAAICAKCLEKDPKRRFQSVDELNAELGRFLAGKPIRTREISFMGRYTRWLKREPTLAWSLTACVAVLLFATIGASAAAFAMKRAWQNEKAMLAQTQESLSQAVEARKKESEAKQRATRAEARTKQQAEIARRLAQANRREANFLTDLFAPLDLIGINQSADNEGRTVGLMEVETINYAAARVDQLPADAFMVKARVKGILANAWRSRGRFDKSESLLTESMELLNEHGGSDDSVLVGDFAMNYLYRGYLHHQREELEKAEQAYLKSIDLQQKWAAKNPSDVVCKLQIAQAQFGLGALYMKKRRNELARPLIESALKLRRVHLAKNDPLLTATELAMYQCSPGRGQSELLRILQSTNDRYSQEAMRLYWSLIQSRNRKDYSAAIATYDKLIQLIEDKLGKDNPIYLLALGDFAGLLRKAGSYERAFDYASQAIAGARDFAPRHGQRMSAMMLLAHELGLAGRHHEAKDLLLEVSLSKTKKWHDSNQLHLALAWCHFHLDDFKSAVAESRLPLRSIGSTMATESAWIYFTHAKMLAANGELDESNKFHARSLHEVQYLIRKSRLPDQSTWLCRMGTVLSHHGMHQQAEGVFRQAITVAEREYFPDHPRVSGLQVHLAESLMAQESLEAATPILRQAFAAQSQRLPKDDVRIGETKRLLDRATSLGRQSTPAGPPNSRE